MEAKRLLTLRDLFYIFFKNKTLIVMVLISSVAIASIYCVLTPPKYRAETKILIKMGKAQFTGIEQMPERQNILIQERTQNIRNEIELIKGQYLTEKVIGRLKGKIEPLKKDQSAIGKIFGGVKEGLKTVLSAVGIYKKTTKEQSMISTFMSALKVNFLEDTDMISLTFTWTDSLFAALAANLYADEYVTQHTLVNESQRSYRFYAEQTDMTEKMLKETEDNLSNFIKTTNIANIALQKELLLKSVADLENRHNVALLEISQAVAKIKMIKGMMAKPNVWIETPELGSSMFDRHAYLRTIDESYFKIMTERERLLKYYTPVAGEVKALDRQLENLRKQKGDSLINIASMELSLAENKRIGLAKELGDMKKDLNEINAKTYTLKQLERERELTEQSYQFYKKKGEELRISDDLDTRRISSVRIATPAIPPLSPSYPKKGFIIGASALIGLFLSFGFSSVREFFSHTFRDDNDVAEVLEIPVLVSVPLRVSTVIQTTIFDRSIKTLDGYFKTFINNRKKRGGSLMRFSSGDAPIFGVIILAVVGITGYFYHLYQGIMPYYNKTSVQGNASRQSDSSRQSIPSSLTPSVMPIAHTSLFNGDTAVWIEEGDEAANLQTESGMDLLSDRMERRRIEFEQRRALLEAELERLKEQSLLAQADKEQNDPPQQVRIDGQGVISD